MNSSAAPKQSRPRLPRSLNVDALVAQAMVRMRARAGVQWNATSARLTQATRSRRMRLTTAFLALATSSFGLSLLLVALVDSF